MPCEVRQLSAARRKRAKVPVDCNPLAFKDPSFTWAPFIILAASGGVVAAPSSLGDCVVLVRARVEAKGALFASRRAAKDAREIEVGRVSSRARPCLLGDAQALALVDIWASCALARYLSAAVLLLLLLSLARLLAVGRER